MISYHLYKAPIEVLQEYEKVLSDKIGDKGGIYILHKGTQIYYIGKATQLRKRLKQHFSDKHKNKWNSFSLYVVDNNDFLDSLERMLVTLIRPCGNSTLFKIEARFKRELAKEIQILQKQHIKELFADIWHSRKHPSTKKISRIYKSKTYTATLNTNGTVLYNKKIYPSLTAVAKLITGARNISGPKFWKLK